MTELEQVFHNSVSCVSVIRTKKFFFPRFVLKVLLSDGVPHLLPRRPFHDPLRLPPLSAQAVHALLPLPHVQDMPPLQKELRVPRSYHGEERAEDRATRLRLGAECGTETRTRRGVKYSVPTLPTLSPSFGLRRVGHRVEEEVLHHVEDEVGCDEEEEAFRRVDDRVVGDASVVEERIGRKDRLLEDGPEAVGGERGEGRRGGRESASVVLREKTEPHDDGRVWYVFSHCASLLQ